MICLIPILLLESEREFIEASNISPQVLKKLMQCEIGITDDIAEILSKVLNTPSDIWLNFKKNYDFQIKVQFEEEKVFQQKLPYYF